MVFQRNTKSKDLLKTVKMLPEKEKNDFLELYMSGCADAMNHVPMNKTKYDNVYLLGYGDGQQLWQYAVDNIRKEINFPLYSVVEKL